VFLAVIMQAAILQSPFAERLFRRRVARRKRSVEARSFRPGRRNATVPGHGRPWAIMPLVALLLVSAGTARAAQSNEKKVEAIRVAPSPQIFATLCALYTAGFPFAPDGVSPQLSDTIAGLDTLKGPAVTALREFYDSHRLSSDSDTLARYISFAMVVGPPPSFQYVLPREQLPPDVRDLEGFQKVLANFYQQENVEDLWEQVQPSYEAEAARLRGPVSQIVAIGTGYARRMNRFAGDRTFSVFVDPLVGSQTDFRIYSESYAIAVNPAASGMLSDIRLAFLHFLLDPLPFNNLALVESKSYLLNFAVHAPRLPDVYKQEFVAFTAECLVRAVDLRLGSLPASAVEAALTRDDRDGYILVRPLYRGLAGYESSPGTLADYFPQLLKSIDVKAESARDEKIAFAPAGSPAPSAQEAGAERIRKWLDEGNRQIASQDGKAAAATFARILQVDPQNTRAQYGMAVAAVLNGQGERAHQLFEQIVNTPAVDPSVLAWSHIYLGRMNDLAGNRQDAVAQYQAALAVAGAPPVTRTAAEQGIKQPFAAQKSDPSPASHR
jgi:Tetratricopeptide repeat